MTDYILHEGGITAHYFYRAGTGICRRERQSGRWSGSEILCSDGQDGFAVYLDAENTVHMICSNPENQILYLTRRQNNLNRYVLSQGSREIIPFRFLLLPSGSFLNLFYSVGYGDEVLLIHCVLGANAQPVTVDHLLPTSPHFFISYDKVYYTNASGVLGYQDYSDGRPIKFVPVAKNAHMPYALHLGEEEYLVYKMKNKLCINGEEIFEDYSAENPVLLSMDNRLTLQWKSGGFVRYITSFNGGRSWSAPMRFISNGYLPSLFYLPRHRSLSCCYGHNMKSEPVLYEYKSEKHDHPPIKEPPKPSMSESITSAEKTELEIKKLKISLELLRREVRDLKKETAVLHMQRTAPLLSPQTPSESEAPPTEENTPAP